MITSGAGDFLPDTDEDWTIDAGPRIDAISDAIKEFAEFYGVSRKHALLAALNVIHSRGELDDEAQDAR